MEKWKKERVKEKILVWEKERKKENDDDEDDYLISVISQMKKNQEMKSKYFFH